MIVDYRVGIRTAYAKREIIESAGRLALLREAVELGVPINNLLIQFTLPDREQDVCLNITDANEGQEKLKAMFPDGFYIIASSSRG